MQATRQTPLAAHVTRFDAALAEDAAAAADLTALAGVPDAISGASGATEALCVALWIGAAAGVLPPNAVRGLQATARNWRVAEDQGMSALRRTADGDGPMARQATRDLRRALSASRAGRLAAMASWAQHAAPPPGPGAMEENVAILLTQGGGAAAGQTGGAAAQMRLSRLIDAADAAMARALDAALAEQAEADAPHPLALAAFEPMPPAPWEDQ
jgi:hypothetical protein